MKYKAQLIDYLTAYPDYSLTRLAELIYAENKSIKLSLNSIKTYLSMIKREKSDVITVDNTPAYNVVGDRYVFGSEDNKKTFSIKQIDQIFLHYVRKGYNFSRSKIQQRFNLTPQNFGLIQRVFHLSKESDLFSPYTKQNTPREELESLTENLMQEIINSGEMTSQKYSDALDRKYRQIIEKENLDQCWRQEVISELIEHYPKVETITLKKTKFDSYDIEEYDANISDLHGGAKSDKMKITESWSVEKFEEYLTKTAQIINSKNARKVHLNILGDLVETVSGVNHPDSWKIVQEGMYGAHVIIEVKNIIARFISKVNNVVSVNGVGGNHDRLQASNKLADTGATDLIFYMLEQELKATNVEVNYDPVLLALDREGYGVIIYHGDLSLHKRSLDFLILEFAKSKDKYQFCIGGHFHQYKSHDSQHIGVKLTAPSIVTGNHYSDSKIGKNDLSGFVGCHLNVIGVPKHEVERLK